MAGQTAEFWEAHLVRWRQSGLTQNARCGTHRLNPKSLQGGAAKNERLVAARAGRYHQHSANNAPQRRASTCTLHCPS